MESNYHITRDDVISAPDKKKLCIFCHYDKNNVITASTIYYLSGLADSCDVIFISNCPALHENELLKIKPYVHRIILRENIGYDFGAYYSAFQKLDSIGNYEGLLFANDSVYGPFYPLKEIFSTMAQKNFDVWSITEGAFPQRYLQSYFIYFANKAEVITALKHFFRDFQYLTDKDKIVEQCEFRLTSVLESHHLKLGALCPADEIINFEKTSDDEFLASMKNDISNHFRKKKSSWKDFFSAARRKKLNEKIFYYTYLTPPQYCSWFTMVKYFHCPFIKKALIKDPRNLHYHKGSYKGLISKLYPAYRLDNFDE